MNADDLCYQTLTEAAALLRRRETSPLELTRALLARIERLDSELHSYVTITADLALAQAERAERELAAGTDRGSLHGVPIAIKDLCATRGVRTTCASTVLADFVPDHDAAVVERLEQAGAVLLGKLNLTEFAMSGYAPSLPIPVNPWDAGVTTGGSSSGSGVATAAGLCFASIGTDTGGSIRLPSSWCGVVGLKPTYGRVSRYGVFPLAMTLDHVGPMTRSVADAAAVLDAIAGRDERDATSLDEPPPACTAALAKGVRGVRIGYDESYTGALVHSETLEAITAALEVLRAHGARIVPVTLPDVTPTLEAWFVLCATEAVVGHEATYPARADEYGPSFRSFLDYGAGLRAADYARAHLARVEFAHRCQSIFAEADVFACPGAFMEAPPASAIDPYGAITPVLAPFLRFSAPFNFSGNPTLSVPAGFSRAGLPLGLQLVGPRLGEAILCQVGEAYERATEWHRRRPPL
jgi:amidase